GLHYCFAILRHRFRNNPGVLAQTDLWLQILGVCYRYNCCTVYDSLGTPYVCNRFGIATILLLDDHAHRSSDGREVCQLDRYYVAGVDHLRNTNAVEPWLHGHLPVWRSDRYYPGCSTTGLPRHRYVLLCGALPLRRFRYCGVCDVCWLLLLVAKVHRKDAQRDLGQDLVLDDFPMFTWHILSPALVRRNGYATSLCRLHGRRWVHDDEPVLNCFDNASERCDYYIIVEHLLHSALC